MSSKIDQTGDCIKIDMASGLVRIDGVPVFKVISAAGTDIRLQFVDGDRLRSEGRGTRYIEIPLTILIEKITILCT